MFHFFAFKMSRGCFPSMFKVIIHRYCEASSYQFLVTFAWMWAEWGAPYTSEFILTFLESLINRREHIPLAATHAHALILPPPCSKHDVGCFGSWAFPFLLQNLSCYFRCFLAKCYLAFLFLNVTTGSYLVVTPLYLYSWRCLYVVESDNVMPTIIIHCLMTAF